MTNTNKAKNQEVKETAVPAEGTVTAVEDKKPWLKRMIENHPTAWKWAKRIGTGVAWCGSVTLAYLAGKGVNAYPGTSCAEAESETTDDDNEDIGDEI